MSGRTSAMPVPHSAAMMPAMTAAICTSGAASITGAKRISRKPPALTRPACISAETGVGAVIDPISQPSNGGSAERAIAATRKRAATMMSTTGSKLISALSIAFSSMLPACIASTASATSSAASPMMKARRARRSAVFASAQPSTWPISEASSWPLASQPSASVNASSAATASSTLAASSATVTAKRCGLRSARI